MLLHLNNSRFAALAVILAAFVTPIRGISQDHQHDNSINHSVETTEYALFDNLGDHHFPIRTERPDAQAFFDQGLRLYYAFNHAEAIKSFREAQRYDPGCAMCYWGEALAYGPNINMPMDDDGANAASAAIDKANDLRVNASPLGRQLIDAVAARYSRIEAQDRADLDSAYAATMRQVVAENPGNFEVSVLYAEAVMTTMPWDYWRDDKTPKPEFRKALLALEEVMEAQPEHPGACHFYIHAVEKYYPEKAVSCAERLAALMPGAGHIVHMPGHIYIRLGRYQDAISANEHAVHADESYIQDRRPGIGVYTAGYYPHNYDFMAFAALMIGDCDLAIESAEKVRDVIPSEMAGLPGFAFLQHYQTRPLQMLVGCNRWDEILDYPEPDASLNYANLIWHYARGRALAAKGNLSAAQNELSKLKTARAENSMEGLRIEPNMATQILAIAETVLAGWIESAAGQTDRAISLLAAAVEMEDNLLYGEPPEWSVPVRHDLGEIQLKHNRFASAVKTFEQALSKFPNNAPAIAGLNRGAEGIDKSP